MHFGGLHTRMRPSKMVEEVDNGGERRVKRRRLWITMVPWDVVLSGGGPPGRLGEFEGKNMYLLFVHPFAT